MRDIGASAYALAQYGGRILGSAALFDAALHKAEHLLRDSLAGYVALFHYLLP